MNPKKQKAVYFVNSDKDFTDDKKPLRGEKFYQYCGKFSHSMDECTTLKAQIKKDNFGKSKGH